jgi:hypothetical protein
MPGCEDYVVGVVFDVLGPRFLAEVGCRLVSACLYWLCVLYKTVMKQQHGIRQS